MSRLTRAALAVLIALAGASVSVRADSNPPKGGDQSGSAGATAGDNSTTATASNQQTSPGGSANSGSPSGGGSNPCTSVDAYGGPQLNEGWKLAHNDYSAYGVPPGVDPATGTWWLVSCPPDPGAKIVWVGPGVASAPTVNPILLAQQALATIHFPAPAVGMAPSSSTGVVNWPTYLWIDPAAWQPFTATASAGPVSATVTAAPDKVVWDMGDGNQVTCVSPGVPWNQSMPHTDCSYVYPRDSSRQPAGRYTMSVRVYWHVTWTAAGATGGGDLGDIGGATATTPVRVDEIQTVVTG